MKIKRDASLRGNLFLNLLLLLAIFLQQAFGLSFPGAIIEAIISLLIFKLAQHSETKTSMAMFILNTFIYDSYANFMISSSYFLVMLSILCGAIFFNNTPSNSQYQYAQDKEAYTAYILLNAGIRSFSTLRSGAPITEVLTPVLLSVAVYFFLSHRLESFYSQQPNK